MKADLNKSRTNKPISGAVTPRFIGIPTFMRLPAVEDLRTLDIALVGVPFDGGTTNRAGPRHRPREVPHHYHINH
jgi:guanidinopropionase